MGWRKTDNKEGVKVFICSVCSGFGHSEDDCASKKYIDRQAKTHDFAKLWGKIKWNLYKEA